MKLSLGLFIQIFLFMGFVGLIYESVSYTISCDKDGQEKPWSFDAIRAPKESYFRYKGSVNPIAIIPGSVMNGLVYGTGVILMVMMNYYLPAQFPIWGRILLFGVSAALLELIVGLYVNKDHKQWDYRGNKLNIAGQTDLRHMLLWMVGGSFFTLYLIPKLYPTIENINSWGKNNVGIVVVLLMLCVYLTYATEQDYKKGKEPLAIKFFDMLEPNFPKKREKC